MSVTHDYRCAAHGAFEATEAACPYGCPAKFVKLEFNQAPAYHNGKTRFVDRQLRGIAQDAGLTDLRNDRGAPTSVMENLRGGKIQQAKWGKIDHAAPGFSRTGDKAPVFNPQSMGFQPPEPGTLPAAPPIRPAYAGRWNGKDS